MLFNSLQFLIFFPVVSIIYFLLPHRLRWLHLLIASCIFYCAFIPIYILILFFTIIIDYVAGIYIESSEGRRRKTFLTLSILANVGVLAVFKYYNFFIDNSNYVAHAINPSAGVLPYLNIILPIGLSFHTFQAMSYTIEVYRGNQKAERHFGIYSLYVMFYPQLVAGPIERPQNLLHQFKEEHTYNSTNMLNGLRLMLWGLFKKVVIADRLAIYVNAVYGAPDKYNYLHLAIATICFTIQIYCDFSGYSDIAIGTAKTMGFDLMINFKRPYFSQNIQEFWKKWHISLSTWFRDYLYISLGGNKISVRRTYLNVAIIFLVSGIWHGANWTFFIWGALHTLFIISYMLMQRYGVKMPDFKGSRMISAIITFMVVAFAWIFFRANNVRDALYIVKHMLTMDRHVPFSLALLNSAGSVLFDKTSILLSLFFVSIMLLVERYTASDLLDLNDHRAVDIIVCTFAMSSILLFGVFSNTSFIYFQF